MSSVYLQDGINEAHQKHKYSTGSGNLALFKPHSGTHGQKSFLFINAIYVWNSLQISMQSQQCQDIFKKEVKSHSLSESVKQRDQSIFMISSEYVSQGEFYHINSVVF